MSLVRISKQLLHDVGTKIDQIKQKDAELTLEPLKPEADAATMTVLFDAGVNRLWGEHLHLKDTLPSSWITYVDRMDVSIIGTDRVRIGDEIQINRKTPCPPNSSSGYGYVEVKIPVQEAPEALIATMERYAAAKEAFGAKYGKLHHQILGFLRGCKSLNDALKKFPDLALYVPKHYLDKVEEVVDRAAREKGETPPEMEIDRNMITSIGVLGKLQS